MNYFNAIAETDSFSVSDIQVIEALAPVVLLLFGVGVLSWVVEFINNFRS